MRGVYQLSGTDKIDASKVGKKAWNLTLVLQQGIKVPQGLVLGKSVYEDFIKKTRLDKDIITELGRKDFSEMRWEEMWDASLRIRNKFAKALIPRAIEKQLLELIREQFGNKRLVIRSSSLAEDSLGSSFAGVHESFVNIQSSNQVIESIKLVWSSLWSDAALLYRKEMGLSVTDSAMAVIIQEMIVGEFSGVGFCESPHNKAEAIIESVCGLNKGLVDGDVEPDRFIISRNSGALISTKKAELQQQVLPNAQGGTRIASVQNKKSLDVNDVSRVFEVMCILEKQFKAPQDVEWTLKDGEIYVLQSRPITMLVKDEKSWNLSLKRSFDNLEKLAYRIEEEILPQMDSEASDLLSMHLEQLTNAQLIGEIEKREKIYKKWKDVYWDECIPFAHGIRLFGTIYNDQIKPEDPFEFIDLLLPEQMKSTLRNDKIARAAKFLKNNPLAVDADGHIVNKEFEELLGSVRAEIQLNLGDGLGSDTQQILKLLSESAKGDYSTKKTTRSLKEQESAFLSKFSGETVDFGSRLLKLARKSYQLRDDDNIYLGKIEAALLLAIKETNARFEKKFGNEHVIKNAEEAIKALKFPDYKPKIETQSKTNTKNWAVNARQMRGQPAGKGFARGKARVVKHNLDLFEVKKNDVLVCDSIDPNMTFIIPLVSAIVERRGGMLVHGAIIAREYGLPCVTGIPHADLLIKTGDDISVDGYYGLVTNHSRTLP